MKRAVLALAVAATLLGAPAASARLTAITGFAPGSGRVVVARDNGSHRKVLGGGDSAWISPDGRRVAVVDYAPGNGGGNPRLKVYRSAGGPPLWLIHGDFYPATWSPDSTKLAATTGVVTRRLVVIDARTGAQTTLATGDLGGAAFSPHGRQIAFERYGGAEGPTLQVVDVATHAVRTLRHNAASPVWGPHAIAFSTTTRRHGDTVANVATIRPDGSHFRRLTHREPSADGTGLHPVDWSASGRRLLAVMYGVSGVSGMHAYGIDAARGGARLIARNVEPQALARNGRQVIGQTGNPFCCSAAPVNVVRVPWSGGKRRILLRKAFGASYSG